MTMERNLNYFRPRPESWTFLVANFALGAVAALAFRFNNLEDK